MLDCGDIPRENEKVLSAQSYLTEEIYPQAEGM